MIYQKHKTMESNVKVRVLITVLVLLLFASYEVRCQSKLFMGTVVDSVDGKPLQDVTISTSAGKVKSNKKGLFEISVQVGDTLLFDYLGYHQLGFRFSKNLVQGSEFRLIPRITELEMVEVFTGYQRLSAEKSTGSYHIIKKDLIDRSVSTSFINRLENLSPGLQFNHGDAEKTDPFLIRGRSTISANAQPLIVLDDFPYDGDMNNINPNDIESVNILRDAAAASIWGARAGNGVIVIKTKRGSSIKPKLEWMTNLSAQGKPDLLNVSTMGAQDRIEWERFLFEKGHYNVAANALTLGARVNPLPEAVELMIASPDDLIYQLDQLKIRDVRNDIGKYLYRNSFKQQYHLNLSGNTEKLNYVFATGFDNNINELVGSSFKRFNLRTSNSYNLTQSLRLQLTMQYTGTIDRAGDNTGIKMGGSLGLSPYSKLADVNGNSLPIFSDYRKGFIDTITQRGLQDWYYRPLDEVNLNVSKRNEQDFLLNTGISYTLLDGLDIDLKYQYQDSKGLSSTIHESEAYYSRNLINRFAQINRVSGLVSNPIPIGGIAQFSDSRMIGHQGRFQFGYKKDIGVAILNAIAGYEIRTKVTKGQNFLYYGYDGANSLTNPRLDYLVRYAQLTSTGTAQIPTGSVGINKYTDNFLSYYANFGLEFYNKYIFSGSFRKDEANLFGVESNMKGTPLWSAGFSWLMHKESFLKSTSVDYLKLRLTYGVNGNVSRAASAYARAALSSRGETHSFPTAVINGVPNKNLRWERVNMLNTGTDFGFFKNKINGSIDFYIKDARDLLAQSPTDPTLGFNTVYANTAQMHGKGWDVQLNYDHIFGDVSWRKSLLYSYSENKVSKYLMPVSKIGRTYLTSLSTITPIEGKPLYAVHSFPWGGLDPIDGAPRSYLDGEVSRDYSSIYNGLSLEELNYHGTVQPIHYGALMNNFEYKGIGLSFNISYKFDYFFRVPTVYNSGLVNGWTGHGDYSKRWQNPGDEEITHVPAMIYPAITARDNVYQYASIHILRGDNIRLEDINLSYTWLKLTTKIPFESIKIFAYFSQLGTLWMKNKGNIDPYFNNTPKASLHTAFGIKVNF